MRLFLAVDLPGAERSRLAALQDRLRSECSGWRWAAPPGIHLTIRFLGEIDAEQDQRAREGWRRAAASASCFRLQLAGLGRFPPTGRPRVLWVGTRDDPPGSAAALAAAVEQAAHEAGFAPEPRPFRPHLTLARAARGRRQQLPSDTEFAQSEAFEVGELVLFRSQLQPHGARYTALERFPLTERA
jgi:2'-5' RNA ligase